jgi:phage terminase small subunit
MPRGLPKVREAIEQTAEKLTAKQKGLVDNMLIPGTTQEVAAVKAGYAESSAHVQASRTLRLPHVQAYINAVVAEGIQTYSIRALAQISDLSANAKSEFVKLQAGQDILDRAGHKPDQGSSVSVGELNVHIDLS